MQAAPAEMFDSGHSDGLSRIDDSGTGPHSALEQRPQQRIVRAAEQKGIGIHTERRGFGVQLGEINLDDFGGDGMVDPAFFDERHEQRQAFSITRRPRAVQAAV